MKTFHNPKLYLLHISLIIISNIGNYHTKNISKPVTYLLEQNGTCVFKTSFYISDDPPDKLCYWA